MSERNPARVLSVDDHHAVHRLLSPIAEIKPDLQMTASSQAETIALARRHSPSTGR